MQSQTDAIIKLENVSVRYHDIQVLENINFEVSRHDFIAITGPNGGGKTTLLRVLLKLVKPNSGTVKYLQEGKAVRNIPIGYLPQKTNIDTRFPITVEEVVRSGLLKGFFGCGHSCKDKRRFEEVVKFTGIGEYLDKTIFGLSGGQLQRTLLGRALISDPEVLVLDEPLSYVDKEFERQIYSLMEELASRATIILVSHEMSVISGMASRHIIIDNHGLHECGAHRHYVPAECCD